MSDTHQVGIKFVLTLIVAAFGGGFLSSVFSYLWFEPGNRAELRKREQLEKLVAPVVTNLERTKVAYRRYQDNRDYGHVRWLYDSNVRVRGIILAQSHLVPIELVDDAVCLIVHYDAWINRYEDLLQQTAPAPTPSSKFNVDLADMSYKDECSEFPDQAEQSFKAVKSKLSNELGIR